MSTTHGARKSTDNQKPLPVLAIAGGNSQHNLRIRYSCRASTKEAKSQVRDIERGGLSPQLYPLDAKNQASIQQPALIRTCVQIRTESRGFFYAHRLFKLHIWQQKTTSLEELWLRLWQGKTCLERATRWLDAIGPEAQRQIRKVEIDLYCAPVMPPREFTQIIDHIHAKLSDEATVVYRSAWRVFESVALWDLGVMFYYKNPARVPLFEHSDFRMAQEGGNVWAPWPGHPWGTHGTQ